jgi:hypothetical protein
LTRVWLHLYPTIIPEKLPDLSSDDEEEYEKFKFRNLYIRMLPEFDISAAHSFSLHADVSLIARDGDVFRRISR